MKIQIRQEQLNNLILNYLNKNYVPDYGWGSDLFDFYKNEVRTWNYVSFNINDILSFVYFEKSHSTNQDRVLLINPWLGDDLTSLFGDFWIPVFKDWFESNTNLKVDNIRVDT